MQSQPKITVIGSINMDLIVRCQQLPVPGQTVTADSTMELCGGKGANQAVAASRAGGKVAMVGRVGDDAFGHRLIENLQTYEVNCDNVNRTTDCPSGLAIVAVERSGENSILVAGGANHRVTIDDVERTRTQIEQSDVVLLQLEIPVEPLLLALRIAREAGVRTILDPAPALSQWPSELFDVDLLCPNKTEAAAIVGYPIETLAQAEQAAHDIRQRGVRRVALTLGDRGTWLCDGVATQLIPAFAIEVVDTTAAGDAFAGALAVAWTERSLPEATRFASAAGALAVSRMGAQTGIATRAQIDELLE